MISRVELRRLGNGIFGRRGDDGMRNTVKDVKHSVKTLTSQVQCIGPVITGGIPASAGS